MTVVGKGRSRAGQPFPLSHPTPVEWFVPFTGPIEALAVAVNMLWRANADCMSRTTIGAHISVADTVFAGKIDTGRPDLNT